AVSSNRPPGRLRILEQPQGWVVAEQPDPADDDGRQHGQIEAKPEEQQSQSGLVQPGPGVDPIRRDQERDKPDHQDARKSPRDTNRRGPTDAGGMIARQGIGSKSLLSDRCGSWFASSRISPVGLGRSHLRHQANGMLWLTMRCCPARTRIGGKYIPCLYGWIG